jgi:Zn-dependent peptidase ImmA (M78 family)
MALRRGFKTEANDIAREIRGELGLHSTAVLDPRRLAELLAIPVIPLSAFSEIPQVVRYFTRKNKGEFSGLTVFRGTERLVVFNDGHSPARQASDVTHELSHGLLLHDPKPALDSKGCREWDQDCEEEANWLASVLLVTEEAALAIAQKGLTEAAAAATYGVSVPLMRWRLNMTAARIRVARARRYSRR